MQTNIVERYANTDYGREAEAILRKCVHCGFCTATCPTYQLLGDELDGPRGRIYQIKEIPLTSLTSLLRKARAAGDLRRFVYVFLHTKSITVLFSRTIFFVCRP